jgi:hypothetical protein
LSTDFTTGQNTWIADAGTNLSFSDLGAAFTINAEDEAPTIYTDFYIFFGYVEVKLRAANGVGIISSIVLESDDLDEIDWVNTHLVNLCKHPLIIQAGVARREQYFC